MRKIHDQVTTTSNQAQTYHQIIVELFEITLGMSGQYSDLAAAYTKGQLLRVADCQVKERRIDHFLRAQEEIWIPGMRQSEGMLGGSFNRSIREPNRFLVTSIWDSQRSHDRYSQDELPILRRKSEVADDVEAITGRLIRLEASWLIQPRSVSPISG